MDGFWGGERQGGGIGWLGIVINIFKRGPGGGELRKGEKAASARGTWFKTALVYIID